MAQREVRTSFLAAGHGLIMAGTSLPDSHPALQGRDHLLVPAVRRPVEQATAAPGEVRTVKSPCDVDGCDYVGTFRGLKIHAGRAH